MKKIILMILIFVFIMLGIYFCFNAYKSAGIRVTLKNNTDSIKIKIGKVFTYSLMGEEYKFKITNIKDNKIIFEVNKYGLTNTNSLISKDNKFTIEKGNKLKLHTQTTDYQESIIFEY